MRFGLAAVAALLIPLSAGSPAEAASAERGRQIVARDCGRCHAVGPRGASPNREAPPFRQLHTRYDVENLAEALGEGIFTGHPAMPQFRFTAAEIDNIIAFLKTLERRGRPN